MSWREPRRQLPKVTARLPRAQTRLKQRPTRQRRELQPPPLLTRRPPTHRQLTRRSWSHRRDRRYPWLWCPARFRWFWSHRTSQASTNLGHRWMRRQGRGVPDCNFLLPHRRGHARGKMIRRAAPGSRSWHRRPSVAAPADLSQQGRDRCWQPLQRCRRPSTQNCPAPASARPWPVSTAQAVPKWLRRYLASR